MYTQAVEQLLRSRGKALLIAGVLVRDTGPSESDLRAPARDLAALLSAAARAELYAWYLPIAISDWPSRLGENAP
jgi:hypothetical protein